MDFIRVARRTGSALVDTRSAMDYEIDHVPGAVHLNRINGGRGHGINAELVGKSAHHCSVLCRGGLRCE